jgi:amyloid beta A4 precursor protein-binding family B member 2
LKSEADKPIRFSVRSLGWVEIAEEDLTPERSSKAVNKCILDLSFGKNDLLDVIGRWGDVSARFEYLIPFTLPFGRNYQKKYL